MKKISCIFCAAAVLLSGLCGCGKSEKEDIKTVDLRYRVADSYDLPASGAQSFTIMVTSTEPWVIKSAHPDWCIIDIEEGEASDPEAVRTGKATPVTARVQYYDNTGLDDRDDTIEISSDYWVGKTVKVHQKGIAFLTVPEEDLEQDVVKAGGDYVIHVESNQDWSVKVTSGDWISVKEGAAGHGIGTATVTAVENTSELRYAEVTVYDRHEEAVATVKFTQDGVQLVPAANEIRASFDQLSAEVAVEANAAWTVEKASEADDWFTIETPEGEGNGTIRISLTKNEGTAMRKATILLKNKVANEGDYQAEKEIVVKQAFEVTPQKFILDDAEMEHWTSDWANTPAYTAGVGTLFTAKARLNRTMKFGTYTFNWSNFSGKARVRHWFCFDDGTEVKADIRPGSGKVSFDFNAPSSGSSDKPSLSSFYDVDFSKPVALTCKFDPSGAGYCHVTFLVNGVEAGSFDTSENLLHTVKWGSDINMYIGVQDEGSEGASAVCEWYEYTVPVNWDE